MIGALDSLTPTASHLIWIVHETSSDGGCLPRGLKKIAVRAPSSQRALSQWMPRKFIRTSEGGER